MAMNAALSKSENTALAECEAVIERGLATFVEVGRALLHIRDERLYRAAHRTFEFADDAVQEMRA